MRVIIISDLEGVAGIVRWEQTSHKGGELFQEARRLYTQEINAAVRGASAAGATEIIVVDCHGAGGGYTFNSLIAEDLDPACEWVVQHRWTEYTAALEDGCDAALLIGMHARAGCGVGVLNHTVSAENWYELRFNGVAVGETGINAALCGHWGCPVVLVTGDDATCEEATALLGSELTTVTTKHGLGRFSARMTHPRTVREQIEAKARAALSDPASVSPYRPGEPCEIEVELLATEDIEAYRSLAGVEVTDARSIVSRAEDWFTAWRQFYR
jgi:D-amino peptidase